MTNAIHNPPGSWRFFPLLALACGWTLASPAAIIGTNVPSHPLTADRVAALPKDEQGAWRTYLKRSERQRQADQQFIRKEMRRHDLKQLAIPPEARFNRVLPLNQLDRWYGEAEALRIADVVLSFQTPAGGWSKNLNMTGKPRAPGMLFAPSNSSRFLNDTDFESPLTNGWNYVGTFDNDATISQLRYLARVIAATGPQRKPYLAAFLRGLDYIFAAQYPNGGWPQVWPLQGGYHDSITYNDGATLNILTLLGAVSRGTNEFAFVPARVRATATASFKRGTAFVLATQVNAAGHPTIWAQQYDSLTLKPTSARNYEMPSLAASESAGIMMFLMQLPNPDPKTVAAVHAAAAWFEKTEIFDVAFKSVDANGRLLVPSPGSGPIWARYYEIGTDRPIFGDRDKSIHDRVDEISRERRNGYSWYSDSGKRALAQYSEWRSTHH